MEPPFIARARLAVADPFSSHDGCNLIACLLILKLPPEVREVDLDRW